MTVERRSDQDQLIERLLSGDGAVDEKLELARRYRSGGAGPAADLDRSFLAELGRLRGSLKNTRRLQSELRRVLAELMAPPWHPSLYLGPVDTPEGPRALVLWQDTTRVVVCSESVDLASLGRGTPVFLNHEQNVLLSQAPSNLRRCGETATLERRERDGRLTLRSRDEEVIVEAAAELELDDLEPGVRVRWDRRALIAFETLPDTRAKRFQFEAIEEIPPERVGGQDVCLRRLLTALSARILDPVLAESYGQSGRRAVLLLGPPGCGKTLMARVAAAQLQKLAGRRGTFAVVKPGEFESPWVGEVEENIRACFASLRKAAETGFAVLFLDEVESISRIRGSRGSHLADKFLAALLAEIDGFSSRGDVAIITASNRKDLIDPAFLQRIAEVEIAVARPDRNAARAIFEVHFPTTVPVRPNASAAASTREEILERAVSALYAPNADNEICTLHFRDGAVRSIHARDLMSGRLVEQICRTACEAAFHRHVSGGAPGVQVADMDRAIGEALLRLSSTLTPGNAAAHLDDLPQDVDLVRVEGTRRSAASPAHFLASDL